MQTDNAEMARVRVESGETRLDLEFPEVRLVTATEAHVVVALDNAAGDRLVVTLPKRLLGSLVSLGMLLKG